MTLPEAVRRGVEARLGAVRDARAVGGGCINHGTRVELDGGAVVFVKWNAAAPGGMFASEARGLRALRAAGSSLHVPAVAAVCDASECDDDGEAWLALEWLEADGERGAAFDERLGRGLAELHRARAEWWGWSEDNFIGSLPQDNEPARGGWAGFWRTRRLEPQVRRARKLQRMPGTQREWDRLYGRLPELLSAAEDEGPSLLHGDLWSGNVLSAGGAAAVIDPAVYRGHREVDLAMAELFGGFGPAFHAAYEELWPLRPGYRERRGVYQLYYLLVHVNLFGGGYVGQTTEVLHSLI